jgi:hypothetical protein
MKKIINPHPPPQPQKIASDSEGGDGILKFLENINTYLREM